MEKKDIRVLALDLDGTLTNDQKVVTPVTRAALDAAAAKGVTIVLASGRPTAGIMPLAKELGLDKKGGCILSYNGGAIIDCATGETLYRKQLDAKYVPQLCAFAREQGVVIITYNKQGVVTESSEDEWALKECFTCKLPMQKVEDLAAYVDYPICKMLITLDPARRDEVLEAGRKQFAGEIDLYPSSPFFIEAVPLGVAKDVSLGSLLESIRGLHGFCQMHLLKPCNPRNPCLNLLSLFPFFCLKCQRIHTYLLYHRQQPIATGRRQMISQTYLIDKIKISIQYFIGRMPRKDFDQ